MESCSDIILVSFHTFSPPGDLLPIGRVNFAWPTAFSMVHPTVQERGSGRVDFMKGVGGHCLRASVGKTWFWNNRRFWKSIFAEMLKCIRLQRKNNSLVSALANASMLEGRVGGKRYID